MWKYEKSCLWKTAIKEVMQRGCPKSVILNENEESNKFQNIDTRCAFWQKLVSLSEFYD